MRAFLVDGTYELFRQHYGTVGRGQVVGDPATSGTRGVLQSVLQLVADGATHIGVATDHVVESFRNRMWAGYKTGEGIEPILLDQFGLLEEALVAMGVVTWPMVELEADDALASACATCVADPAVEQVVICTPDKDLGQCVTGVRVVQVDRRSNKITDEDGVIAKFGVRPASIPDWLGLVGDSADGFPGLPGWGAKSAAAVLWHYDHIEAIPDAVGQWEVSVRSSGALASTLAAHRDEALLFKDLATLRIDPSVLATVDDLRWRGPTDAFADVCERIGTVRTRERAEALAPR